MEQAKQYVLGRFRSRLYEGSRLEYSAVVVSAGDFIPANVLSGAIEELAADGLIRFQSGGSFLALTNKGLRSAMGGDFSLPPEDPVPGTAPR